MNLPPPPAAGVRAPRDEYLDSCRGLAALSVVMSHMVCRYSLPPSLYPLIETPFRALWHGKGAVAFFFLLSGYVLTLPFLKAAPEETGLPSLAAFGCRRLARILPAFWVVLVLSAFAKLLSAFEPAQIPLATNAWNMTGWPVPAGFWQVMKEALLVWRQPLDQRILGQDWTLAVEIIYSVWVPLLAVVSVRQPGFMLLLLAGAVFGMGANPVLLSFGAGVLIARFRTPWREFWHRSSGLMKAAVAAVAACLYSYETVIPVASLKPLLRILGDPTTAGAAGFLLVVIASRRLQRALGWKPLIWTGRLSYGIYLIHGTVILAGLPWLFSAAAQAGVTGAEGLWYLGFACTVAVSALLAIPLRSYIEIPGNRIGKKLAGRFEADQRFRIAGEAAARSAQPLPQGM